MPQAPLTYDELEMFVRWEIESKNKYLDTINKNYFMYAWDRQVQLQKEDEMWRSNIKTPITRMFVDRVHNMLINAEPTAVVLDKFPEARWGLDDSRTISEEIVDWIDYLLSKEETKKSWSDMIFDSTKDGTGIAKIVYKYQVKTKTYTARDGKEKKVDIKYDYPVLQWKSRYNIFTDYSKANSKEMRFIAERRLLTDRAIIKDYSIYPDFSYKKEAVEGSKNTFVSCKDYESLKNNIAFYPTERFAGDEPLYDVLSDDRYLLKNQKQHQYREVFEVHTPDTVTIYINGIDHGTHHQIGPFDGYKYKFLTFKQISGSTQALGIAKILEPLQFTFDAISNSRIDNVLLTVNKSFLMQNGMNIAGMKNRIKLKPGAVFKVDDLAGIKEIEISEVKESAYKEADVMFQLAQAAVNIPGMFLGVQSKVERVSGAPQILSDAANDQANPLLESMADLMADVAKEFLLLSLVYTDVEEFDKVLGANNKLKDLDIETIIHDYEFNFNFDASVGKASLAENQQLMNLMNFGKDLVDAAGKPILDLPTIITKYAQNARIDTDALLSPEEYVQTVQRMQQAQAMDQQAAMAGQQQQPAPQDPMAAMRQLQTQGGAGPLGELATNPAGGQ